MGGSGQPKHSDKGKAVVDERGTTHQQGSSNHSANPESSSATSNTNDRDINDEKDWEFVESHEANDDQPETSTAGGTNLHFDIALKWRGREHKLYSFDYSHSAQCACEHHHRRDGQHRGGSDQGETRKWTRVTYD